MGYKYQCTEEIAVEVADWLAAGATITRACEAVDGISKSVFFDWYDKGMPVKTEDGEVQEEGEEPYKTFYEMVSEAKNMAELESLRKIRGSKSWQAHAWFLERTRGSHYEKNAQKHEHKVEGEIKVVMPDNGRD